MKTRRILLIIFIIINFECSQRGYKNILDYSISSKIIEAIINEDVDYLRGIFFDNVIYSFDIMKLQYNAKNDFEGFSKKKGKLYMLIFDPFYIKNYLKNSKIISMREAFKKSKKFVGKIFYDEIKLSSITTHIHNGAYSIFLICKAENNCRIVSFESVPPF